MLMLNPLDAAASSSMLRSILGVETVSPQVVDLIHERAGGNPFFLEEITQSLLEEGALQLENGAAALVPAAEHLQLPNTVQGVLRARLDRLDRRTREVLRLASVVGREFTRVEQPWILPVAARHSSVEDRWGDSAGVVVLNRPTASNTLTQEVAFGSPEYQRGGTARRGSRLRRCITTSDEYRAVWSTTSVGPSAGPRGRTTPARRRTLQRISQ
jgi:hypothetical protein